ncbi:MAG: hypothetical protein V9F02_02765 [Chitinophagaceae bacterium]
MSIVALACKWLVQPRVLFCAWLKGCPAMKQIYSCERGVMKRNEGSNERSGVKDTIAARTKAKELQAV